MKYKKSHYQALPSHNGFKWGGFWDGFHHFAKTVKSWHEPISETESIVHEQGCLDMAVLESDIEDGSWKFMADRGLTRIT